MTNRPLLAAGALLALALPAAAEPRAAALEAYRETAAAEKAFADAYPFDRTKMRAARDRLEAARALELGRFQDCASSADTLAGVLATLATVQVDKAKPPIADAYAWRRGCERDLGLPRGPRPLAKVLKLYARP